MAKCSCSLTLGLHPFPSSCGKTEDLLRVRFPELIDFLDKKTEENYFWKGSPKFKLFPPAVLPDNTLPHGFPSSSYPENQTKEKEKWSERFEALHAEQVVADRFIRYFTKNTNFEGFLFARDFHTETFLEKLKDKAKRERKENGNIKKCNSLLLPLSELEQHIWLDMMRIHIG